MTELEARPMWEDYKSAEQLNLGRELRWMLEDARRAGQDYRAHLLEEIVIDYHRRIGREVWIETEVSA